MTRLRRLVPELPASLAALVVAVVVELGLRTTTLPRLAKLLGTPLALEGTPIARQGAPSTSLPSAATRQIRATRRVLRHWPFGDTCLRQALISGQRLRRLSPSLHVGVARIEGEIRAHAWLVIDGAIVDPRRAASSYQDLQHPTGLR